MGSIAVGFNGESFQIKVPFAMNALAKSAPDRQWNPEKKVWVLPYNGPNCDHIRRNFDAKYLSEKAQLALASVPEKPNHGHWPAEWQWSGEPRQHQVEAVRHMWPEPASALFHEMGLGKTYTWISVASARWSHNLIDAVLVICPTSIKDVWRHEFQKFSVEAAPVSVHVHSAGGDERTRAWMDDTSGGMKVLVVGVESLSSAPAKRQGQGKNYRVSHSNSGRQAKRFCETRRVMAVVDESSTIKNPRALRTELAWDLGDRCQFRTIGTGTDITQGIHDLYGQFRFLDWEIIGHKSYFTFKKRYCIEEAIPGAKANAKRIVGYQNVEELMDKVRPYIHQRLKAECLDLPDKVYEVRQVPASAEQRQVTRTLKRTLMLEYEGKELEVSMVMEMYMRFQQIAGGWVAHLDHIDDKGKKHFGVTALKANPKMQELLSVIEETRPETQIIIWSRYRYEIEAIADTLNAAYPGQARKFYGATSEADRAAASADFQDGRFRFMVANQAVGGMGQTWTAATLVIYYTNSFSYFERMQSEDRAHRIGQTNKVTYVDLQSTLAIDGRVQQILEAKGEIADFVDEAMAEDVLNGLG